MRVDADGVRDRRASKKTADKRRFDALLSGEWRESQQEPLDPRLTQRTTKEKEKQRRPGLRRTTGNMPKKYYQTKG
jgi:hypothetical protein